MNYIGKMWIDRGNMSLVEIAQMACLNDIKAYDTEDVIGTMEFKGKQILVILHLSWGEMHMVEKIKIHTHHTLEEDNEFLYRIFEERLRSILN